MTTPAAGQGAGRASERRAARFAAVQAVYQMELTGLDAETVTDEFVEHRFNSDPDIRALGEPDQDFFGDVVRGVPHHQAEIDASIAKCLVEGWKLGRVDSILRAILRAGAYEFIARKDVPARVVIDEYVDLAHAFFEGDEIAFVNAVLDRMAHRKRAPEFGETPPDDELRF
jgi:N utilization substance protein B